MPKRRNSQKRPSELATLLAETRSTSLPYSIYDYSSYSGTYHPNNIYFDTPQNQSSRWSSGSHDGTQFITLRLDQPTIARSILWGKFHRSHVCNVKEFKVYGGLDPNNMSELLFQVLQNHSKPEMFKLRHTYHGLVIPIQYIKIVPISTFSTNFNYSIWYLEIHGITDASIIRRALDEYENFREKETIRLCMKHFRQRNMVDIFQLIKQQSGIELENPLLTQLHTALVKDGDFELAEILVEQIDQQYQIFESFTRRTKYQSSWEELHPIPTTDGDMPCARGGHQMCIDSSNGLIYLHGGWTGKTNLADFWCYSIKENRWILISNDTSRQGGPSARSCHQICLDTSSQSLFVFGRVADIHANRSDTSKKDNLKADFYRYYIETDHWEKLDDHTADNGGPELLFDHQMCVDGSAGKLYVFGGRSISGSKLHQYSGLYSYDIQNSTWKLLRNDLNKNHMPLTPESSSANSSANSSPISKPHRYPFNIPLQSRIGHSMLSGSDRHQLYILGGECAENHFCDLHQYDIDTDTVVCISPRHGQKQRKFHQQRSQSCDDARPINSSESEGNDYYDDDDSDDDDIGTMGTGESDTPYDSNNGTTYCYYRGDGSSGLATPSVGSDLGYTQRATMDENLGQIYVFFGYLRNMGCKTVKNVLRIYHLDRNTWEDIYSNERCHQSSSVPIPPARPQRQQQQSFFTGRSNINGGATTTAAKTTTTTTNIGSYSSSSDIIDAATDYPTPRFSYQWIYDPISKCHYLFGGDPHEYTDSDRRLGDLWKLKLIKPDVHSVAQRCKYLIRVQKFKELCANIEKNKHYDMISQALNYLQTQVTPLVDKEDDEENRILGHLCARLCLLGDENRSIKQNDLQPKEQYKWLNKSIDTFYMDRTSVYTELLKYFPSDMCEPTGNISDALRL